MAFDAIAKSCMRTERLGNRAHVFFTSFVRGLKAVKEHVLVGRPGKFIVQREGNKVKREI
jgi:hypothetical protein